MTTYTYDIHFDSGEHSNNKGFKLTYTEAEKYIKMYNGTNHSYFADYKGGVVSIVCNETSESMKEVKIL